MTPNLTLVYYTANSVPDVFAERVRDNLRKMVEECKFPLVSVSQKPLDFGENVCVGELGHSIWNLYFQVLEGVKRARTMYVGMCEDDCLYVPEHFLDHRPRIGISFLFNLNRWSVRTWDHKPLFSHKVRTVFSQMIAWRQELYDALAERLALRYTERFKQKEEFHLQRLGEPGRYDKELGLTIRTVDTFETERPNVVFDHLYGLQAGHLARRKKHGPDQTFELPGWGRASQLLLNYWGEKEWKRQQKRP